MPRKRKDLNKEALQKEKEFAKVYPSDFDSAFDALDATLTRNTEDPEPEEDLDLGFGEDGMLDRNTGSPEFIALQAELDDIRQARKKLTIDMDAKELDKDERDTLKARGMLLDSRERSAREELKLFHKSELNKLGQVKKIRIIIEDTFLGHDLKGVI